MNPWLMLGLLMVFVMVVWAFLVVIEMIAGKPDDPPINVDDWWYWRDR